MIKNLLTFLFCFYTLGAIAQNPIEVTLLQSFTQAEIFATYTFPGQNGVDIYKMLYTTPMPEGTLDTASGLVIIPTNADEIAYPFLSYQHGTVSAREAVPSQMGAGDFLSVVMASQGYVVTSADFIGLGESKRLTHPYTHAASEASAGIDLVRAAKQFMEAQSLNYNEQLFLTGYSQGGHASMAMHREIQTNLREEMTVTAAAHLSGPYSISGEMQDFTLGETPYPVPGFLIWTTLAYQSVYGNIYNDWSEVLKPEYVAIAQQFEAGTIHFGEMQEAIVAVMLELNDSIILPRSMIQEDYLNLILNDPESPIGKAVRDNDVYDWAPESPTRLFYCKADEIVVYTNSILAASVMTANGAADVQAMDVDSTQGHGGCVIPALLSTIGFFNGYAERLMILNTVEVNPAIAFQISPNPATSSIQIKLPPNSAQEGSLTVRLIDLNGRTILEKQGITATKFELSVATYPTGLYLVQLYNENGFWTEKIQIQR